MRSVGARLLAQARRWRIRPFVGAGLVLLGAGVVLVSAPFEDAETTPRLARSGGNVPVNAGANDLRDVSAHNSPTVVANPRRPVNVVVANRIDTPRFSCALHVSFDGGANWRQTPIPVPPAEEPKCYAPDAAFASDGTLYVSFVTLKGRGNVPHAVWVAHSKDGGRTVSRPVKARGPLAFQVRLLADPAIPGRLYMSWLQGSEVAQYAFPRTGNPIYTARSDDGGRSWSAPGRVSAPARERVIAPSTALGPDGLYVLYVDIGDDKLDYGGAHGGRGGAPYSGTWQLVLARSRDGGASWAETVVEPRLVPTQRFIVFIPPFPSLAIDRGSGRIYAAFHDGRLGDPDVRLWSSANGGQSWRSVRVNDTPERDRTAQYLPKLAVAPNGRLDVVYYDRRDDRRNLRTEVSLQSSVDGAHSFSRRLRLSERPFDPRVGFGIERGLPDLGSRLGLLSTSTHALAVWTDTRAGTQISRKQDLGSQLVVFSPPAAGWGDPTLRDALRYGGLTLVLAGLMLVVGWALRRRGSGIETEQARTPV